MDYKFRIQANEKYLTALGRAFYNFAYLEKVARDIIQKLSSGNVVIPDKTTAGPLNGILEKQISSTHPAYSELTKFSSSFFKDAIEIRNKLLHAAPYTAIDGEHANVNCSIFRRSLIFQKLQIRLFAVSVNSDTQITKPPTAYPVNPRFPF